MSLKKHHALFENIQMLDKLSVHPPYIYVLELSPVSTNCTHGIAVKLFCRLMRFSFEATSDECDD
jgi:hypothetical protein